MALINLYPKEITRLLDKNIQSKYLTNLRCEGKMLLFDVKTAVPLIKKVPVSLEFLKFEKGKLYFEVKSNFTLDKLMSLPFVKDRIEKQINYRHLYVDLPIIYFDIDSQLQEKTNDLKIENIQFVDDTFIVDTNIKNLDFNNFAKK